VWGFILNKIDRLVDFLMACRSSYNDQVPYHNFRHVVDVLQAIFYFMLSLGVLPAYGGVDNTSQYPDSLSHIITPLDALTLLIVAIGHDVGHPGVNNAFLVTLKAPLAQLYNDKSVLESFHCAAFSQVLLNHWPKTTAVRKMMIDMILATDMGLHFDFMGKLDKLQRKYVKDGGFDTWDDKAITDYRTLLCALLIKCADISNVVCGYVRCLKNVG
jgi:3',5'-cyclic-nucleotide phosphodiesterase